MPILLAAARFGLRGAVLTALMSGLVAGPLLPLEVSAGTAQPFSDWGSRTLFFLGTGSFMALLITRLQASLAQELRFALQERDLAVRKGCPRSGRVPRVPNTTHGDPGGGEDSRGVIDQS